MIMRNCFTSNSTLKYEDSHFSKSYLDSARYYGLYAKEEFPKPNVFYSSGGIGSFNKWTGIEEIRPKSDFNVKSLGNLEDVYL